jgi:hypothetical protein
MKTKFGSIIVDGSGKIGGHVASKNKDSNFLRTKVKPKKSEKFSSIRQRNNYYKLAKAWRNLDKTTVEAWNNEATNTVYSNSFGDKKSLTGINYFMRINNNLLLLNKPLINTPQTPLPDIESFNQSLSTSIYSTTDIFNIKLTNPNIYLIAYIRYQYKSNNQQRLSKLFFLNTYEPGNHQIPAYDFVTSFLGEHSGPAEKTQFDVILKSAGGASFYCIFRYVDIRTGQYIDTVGYNGLIHQ